MGSKTDVLIRIVEADDRGPNKGGFYRFKTQWTGDKGSTERWCSCKSQLREGQSYTGTMHWEKDQSDKWRYTITDALAVGGPVQEPAPSRERSGIPIMAELRAVGGIVKAVKHAGGEMESTTLNTILMEEFKRGAIERMVEHQREDEPTQEEPGDERLPESQDHLPTVDDMPF